MGNNNLVNLADGTVATDAATLRQAQSGVASVATAVGGTANAVTLTFSPPFASYVNNMTIRFRVGTANTGAVTVNVDTLGAKALKKNTAGTLADVASGDLPAGMVVEALFSTADDCFVAQGVVGLNAAPPGIIAPYAGSTAPTGWLLCFGQNVSRTTFAALFAALGTTYGAGDGSTTFGLPDLRGRAIAGKDDMGGTAASRLTSGASGIAGATLGASGGAETHTLTKAQMPLHGHPFRASYTSTSNAGSSTTGGLMTNTASANTQPAFTGAPSNNQGQQIGGEGGGQAHPNVQPTLILNFIIKT
jgi:microcystin-dependent protein